MKLEMSETSKLSTVPVLPIMSLFNQFSTRSVNNGNSEHLSQPTNGAQSPRAGRAVHRSNRQRPHTTKTKKKSHLQNQNQSRVEQRGNKTVKRVWGLRPGRENRTKGAIRIKWWTSCGDVYSFWRCVIREVRWVLGPGSNRTPVSPVRTNPVDHTRGQVSRKRTSRGCHSKHNDCPKNCTIGTIIEQKGVTGASLPVRSGTVLSPGWVLHRSRLNDWDFAANEPRSQTLARIVSRVSRQTHLTSLLSITTTHEEQCGF